MGEAHVHRKLPGIAPHREAFERLHSLCFWIGEEVFEMLSAMVSKPSRDQRFDRRSHQLLPADCEESLCLRIGSNDYSLLIDDQQRLGGRCKDGVTVHVNPGGYE